MSSAPFWYNTSSTAPASTLSLHDALPISRRAATSLVMNSLVGTSTLPPRWPHFFKDASWSSKCAAAVHFEDQLASLKKCGHLGGKVLVPTSEFITKLVAARLEIGRASCRERVEAGAVEEVLYQKGALDMQQRAEQQVVRLGKQRKPGEIVG